MPTLLFSHPACLDHDTGDYHPECAERLRVVLQALDGSEFLGLNRHEAPVATSEQILRVHSPDHLDFVRQNLPSDGLQAYLDPDTVISAGSWEAALRAAGATIAAVDAVITGERCNAFCAIRPPGHHAEADAAMGFCLFNNVAIGAAHALHAHGLERVAVVDVDVHHGNGTQDIFFDNPAIFYASVHQGDAYPGTGLPDETGCADNVMNVPLPPGTGSGPWRRAFSDRVLPRLRDFAPDLIMVSMGFDAHTADPMAHMRLTTDDFQWITEELCALAGQICENRLVSVLEGGYDLRALAVSTAAHVRALMGL